MILKTTALAPIGLALLLGLGAACGGGGSEDADTPEAYTQELNGLLDELVAARGTAQEEHLTNIAADANLEVQVDAAGAFLTQFRDDVGQFSTGLGELSPPDELKEQHTDLTTSTSDFLETLTTLAERLDTVTTEEALGRVLDRFVPASGAMTTACYTVEDAAVDSGVEVQLNCLLEAQLGP